MTKFALCIALTSLSVMGANITFSSSSANLSAGEVFSITPTTFTLPAAFSSTFGTTILAPYSIDATSYGTPNSMIQLPVVFSVDGGGTATLFINMGYSITGGVFRFVTTSSPPAVTPNAVFNGYPLRLSLDGLGWSAAGTVGQTVSGNIPLNIAVAAPEPATYAMIGCALLGLTMFRKGIPSRRRRRRYDCPNSTE